jgi:hypothetical protein
LQHLLDLRQIPEQDRQLLAHADACDDCRARLDAQQQLFRYLARHSLESAGDGTLTRARRTSHVDRLRRPRSRWLTAGSVLAVAAVAVLLAVVPLAMNAPLGSLADGSSAVQGTDEPPVPSVSTQLVTAGQSGLPDQYSLESAGSPGAADLPLGWTWESDEPLEPVDQIAGGFRSLASTLQLALDAVRQTVPVHCPPEAENPLDNAPQLPMSLRLDWG